MNTKIMIMLFLLICSFCGKSEHTKLIEYIKEHQRTKQNIEIQDAYKLIYQGVFGVGHILDKPEMASKYLKHEFESVVASDDEKLIENISVSGKIIRINLRSYKYRNGDVEQLFQAMLRSAEIVSGSQEEFLSLWNEFKQAVFNGELNFDKDELNDFDNKIKRENYPPMHHSPGYREANQPAYRVLKKEIAETLLTLQNIEHR